MSEWISTKDRIPQYGETIIVCFIKNEKYDFAVAKSVIPAPIDDRHKTTYNGYDAPYWMPVPKPPIRKGGKRMANETIRAYAKTHKVPLWAVAKKMKISEATITRLLRCDLSDEETDNICNIIDTIAKERTSK